MNVYTRVANWVIGIAVVAVVCALWFNAGVSVRHVASYLLVLAWTIMVPGWVVHRMIVGRPRDLTTDVVMGAGVGVVLSTFVWLVLVACHARAGFLAWPVLPLLASLLVRRRVYQFGRYEAHLHPLTSLVAASGTLVAVLTVATNQWVKQLPPKGAAWYIDNPWQLGLAHELQYQVPPADPQVAGDPFWYHWFANAHVAAVGFASGIDLNVVFMRLWEPFIIAVVVGLMVVAGRLLTGRSWPGAVGALLIARNWLVMPTWFIPAGQFALVTESPSQSYSLIPILLVMIGVIALCNPDHHLWARPQGSDAGVRNPNLAAALVFAIGTLGCMGAKGSALPVLLCGIGTALLASLVLRRALAPWLGAMLVFAGVVFVISMKLTSTASAGTQIQCWAVIRRNPVWKTLTHDGSIGDGLARTGGLALLVLLLVAYVVCYAMSLLVIPLLGRSIAAWFLLAIAGGGLVALMVVDQSGMSQSYFMSSAGPAVRLLAAYALWAAWGRARTLAPRDEVLLWAIAFTSIGAVLERIGREAAGHVPSMRMLNHSLAAGLGIFIGGTLVIGVVALALRRRLCWLAVTGVLIGGPVFHGVSVPLAPHWDNTLLPMAALLSSVAAIICLRGHWRRATPWVIGVTALGVLACTVPQVAEGLKTVSRPSHPTKVLFTDDEAAAADWVLHNVPTGALMATNAHCTNPPEVVRCDKRAFWPAGLSGHPTLIGAWSYTSYAHETAARTGMNSSSVPFGDQALFELNQRAFTNPTPEVLEQLRAHGVTVLFGARRWTTVNPALDQLAHRVYDNPTMVVYRLDQ